jgi:predicted alpha/beta superfamily hydrolase
MLVYRLLAGLAMFSMAFRAPACAQVRVQLRLASPPQAAVFVAGSFNQWQPAQAGARFDSTGLLTLVVAKGATVAFKVTQGSWDRVECNASGVDVPNREFTSSADTVIFLVVEGWKHQFGELQKPCTAAPNVVVFDTAFPLRPLAGARRVTVYLPPNYHQQPRRRYGVLYMQDGQNCFDEQRAGFGEWQVDEALNALFDSTGNGLIVVAIDHGGAARLAEYNPYAHPEFGAGLGRLYARFLVETLKPAIDAAYRTLPGQAHTHVAGSSMGGLISCWAVMAYPQVFGSAGIFSPAFWVAPRLPADAARMLRHYRGKLFFYAGGQESSTMIPLMDAVIDSAKKAPRVSLLRHTEPGARHNEEAWRRQFYRYLAFIL